MSLLAGQRSSPDPRAGVAALECGRGIDRDLLQTSASALCAFGIEDTHRASEARTQQMAWPFMRPGWLFVSDDILGN